MRARLLAVISLALGATAGCGKREPATKGGLAGEAAPAPPGANLPTAGATPVGEQPSVATPPPAGAWARCRDVLRTPLPEKVPLQAVTACRELFRPRCAAALAAARPGLTVDEGLGIVRVCADEYCPLPTLPDQPPQPVCQPPVTLAAATHGVPGFIRAVLADGTGADPDELAIIGAVLGAELLPVKAVVARLTSVDGALAITLDGGAAVSLPAAPTPKDVRPFAEAAAGAGADAGGVLLWGWEGASDQTRDAIGQALRQVGVTDVVYCRRDGSNCS